MAGCDKEGTPPETGEYMTREEVHERLCIYHPLSSLHAFITSFDIDPKEPGVWCSCDNCFYGRHPMAVELLKYMDKEQEVAEIIDTERQVANKEDK